MVQGQKVPPFETRRHQPFLEETITGGREIHLKDSIKITLRGFPGGSVLRIRLAMQGTQVQSLLQEDPTCSEATRPVQLTGSRATTEAHVSYSLGFAIREASTIRSLNTATRE